MATNYRQTDPRWGSSPYADETMSVAGCGPTAVAGILSLLTSLAGLPEVKEE